ncbi:MAG TPA: hypothetical protein V6C78_30915 [Crinalium sp.]
MSKSNPSIFCNAVRFISLMIVFGSILAPAIPGWSQGVPSSQQTEVPLDTLSALESARLRYELAKMLMGTGAVSLSDCMSAERDYYAALERYQLQLPPQERSTPSSYFSELEQAEENARDANRDGAQPRQDEPHVIEVYITNQDVGFLRQDDSRIYTPRRSCAAE